MNIFAHPPARLDHAVQMQIAAPRTTTPLANRMLTTMTIQSAPLVKIPSRANIPLLAALPPPNATSSGASTSQPVQALLDLASPGSNATDAQLSAAVQALVASGTGTSSPGPDTLNFGTGYWRVIHAPHINRISSLLNAKFTISYTLLDPTTQTTKASSEESSSASGATSSTLVFPSLSLPPQFYSNVRYEQPLLGSGWLSASGSLVSISNNDVEIRFDQFWVDNGGEKNDLRQFLTEDNRDAGDAIVTAIGRTAFFQGLAVFPVLHLDADAGVAVFRFPPLDSNIAVVRE